MYGKSYISHVAFKFIDDEYDAMESRASQQVNGNQSPFYMPPQTHEMPFPNYNDTPIEPLSVPEPTPVPEEITPSRSTEASSNSETITMEFRIPEVMMNFANSSMNMRPPMPRPKPGFFGSLFAPPPPPTEF